MKALWIILACVVIGGAAALLLPSGGTSASSTSDTPAPTNPTPAKVAPAPQAPVAATVPTAPPAASQPPKVDASAPESGARKQPEYVTKALEAAAAKRAATKEPARTEPPPGGLTLGLDRKIANATIVPGALMKQPDGSILADGKYRIEGAGTREAPYRVAWDCLASAGKTYVPRLKQNDLPQRVAMLDGAWIRIDGYVAFPLMLQESAEVLVMLNQWDGCCIGVPPTPYDAIEAKLTEPMKPGKRHAFNFGTVTGRLKVDPLLVENWLVGLYQLEEATLTQSDM